MMFYDGRWLEVIGLNPITGSSQSHWSKAFLHAYSTAGGSRGLHCFGSLTLHLSWHDSSYHQTSCCSQSLSVWLTYVNCHSMPWSILSLIQVMTIKTVLTGVRALQSAQCYFCLTLRASMLPLHPFRESCIFLHSLVCELSCLFPG